MDYCNFSCEFVKMLPNYVSIHPLIFPSIYLPILILFIFYLSFHPHINLFIYLPSIYLLIYRVFIKNCVFSPIHCNPSPACRRTTHPRKRSECTFALIGLPFLYSQQLPNAGDGEVAKYRQFLEENTIFNEHPVSPSAQ